MFFLSFLLLKRLQQYFHIDYVFQKCICFIYTWSTRSNHLCEGARVVWAGKEKRQKKSVRTHEARIEEGAQSSEIHNKSECTAMKLSILSELSSYTDWSTCNTAAQYQPIIIYFLPLSSTQPKARYIFSVRLFYIFMYVCMCISCMSSWDLISERENNGRESERSEIHTHTDKRQQHQKMIYFIYAWSVIIINVR